MDADELKKRTKAFGLRVIKLVEALPASKSADVIGKQLLRSATSVGANYRAALRARSKPDFISKLSIAIEEADESLFLRLLSSHHRSDFHH
jgi:four helix bundle protein